jgi:hypothetical protein
MASSRGLQSTLIALAGVIGGLLLFALFVLAIGRTPSRWS